MNEPELHVFDFDGCLYPYPEDLVEILTEAAGRAGHEISREELSPEQAGPISIASYYETGLSFSALCKRFNVSLAEGFFHHHQHVHFDLKSDPALIEALENLDREQTHIMILTHSSSCFLDRKLKMLGLDHIFPRHMRVTHDDYDFKLKSIDPAGFVHAVARARMVTGIDFKPERITMYEDSQDNLAIPKHMGWNTALVRQSLPFLYQLPAHIDRQIDTPTKMLRTLPQRPFLQPPTNALF